MLNWLLDKLQKRAQTLTARQHELEREERPSDPTDELVREGYRLHSAGDLAGAEAAYRKILFRQPNHADALYLLGEVCQAKGERDQAIALIEKAVAANPNIAAYRASLGSLYRETGNLIGAEASFRQAVSLDDANPEYLNDLGTTLQDQRRDSEALACFEQALVLAPDLPQALYNIGLIRRRQGRLAEAARLMEQALAQRPDFTDGLSELGSTYLLLDRHAEALECFKKAYGDNSAAVGEAHFAYGNRLLDKHQAKDAVLHYLRALDTNKEMYGTWTNLGNAYRELKQFDEAVNCGVEAIKLNPACAQAYNSLGTALKEMGDCARAKEVYREVGGIAGDAPWPAIDEVDRFCELAVALNLINHALSIDGEIVDSYLNKGVILEEIGLFTESVSCYEKAAAIAPELPHGHYNLGIALLRQGALEKGWEGYESRLRMDKLFNQTHLAEAPLWSGEPLTDKVLLVYAEQGLGDTIQFIRYYKEVAARCRHVVLECQTAARPLVEDITGQKVYEAGTPLPKFDYQIPLLSLPRVLGTRLDNIPAPVPYIFADETKTAAWRDKVSRQPGLKVGLVWAGGAAFAANRFRSTSLSVFSPLADAEGISFISLQKGDPAKEASTPPAGMGLIDWADELRDFRDTAALIANLDLVISVDTSVVHLAGAMGKPVWVLIPFCPDWRWMLDRTDSPWYPTMRLFRQTAIGDWAPCIAQIKNGLLALTHREGLPQ